MSPDKGKQGFEFNAKTRMYFLSFFLLNFILFIFLYSRFLLVRSNRMYFQQVPSGVVMGSSCLKDLNAGFLFNYYPSLHS